MVTLVEAWLTQGVFCEQDGAWRLQAEVEALHDQVPDGLRQLIEGQLDRLRAAEQRVLEVASVAGIEFAAAAVAAGLGQAVERVDDTCAALARRGQWLRAVGEQSWPDGTVAGGYRFGHALYQQVLYRRVVAARRVRLHQRIGARAEVGYGAEAGAQAAELAVHFERGRDYARALQYLRQASENAIQRYSYREAVAYFEQALAALGHLPASRDTQEQAIDLRFDLRTSLIPLGGFGERIRTYLYEAEVLAQALDDPGRLGRVYAHLSNNYWMMAEPDHAVEAGQRALTLAEPLGDVALQVQARCYLGQAYHALGDYRQGMVVLRWNVAALVGERRWEYFGLPGLAAVVSQTWLLWSLAELGEFNEGSAQGEEVVRLAEAADHPFSRIEVCRGVSLLYLRQGKLQQAITVLEKGLDICQVWEIPLVFPWVASALSLAYILVGRVTEALPLLQQMREPTAPRGTLTGRAIRATWRGEAYLLAGHSAEAREQAEQALEFSREHKERGHQAWALRLLGEIAAHQEPSEAAWVEAYYRQALTLAEELRMRPLQAHCHLGLGTLYAKTGQAEQARVALSAAITLYRAMDMTFWLPRAEAAMAQVQEQ